MPAQSKRGIYNPVSDPPKKSGVRLCTMLGAASCYLYYSKLDGEWYDAAGNHIDATLIQSWAHLSR